MDTKEQELIADIRKKAMAYIKGVRTRHVVTMNPSSASPERVSSLGPQSWHPGSACGPWFSSAAVRFQGSQYQDPLPE